jgi:hypothetical protein
VETLKQLGYEVEPPPAPKPQKALVLQKFQVDPRLKEFQEKAVQEITDRFNRVDRRFITGALTGLGLFYLFFCYCSMLICKKVGQQPGILVWLPVIQTFPMLKAAGMSAWWFLLLLVPLAGVVVSICWCVKICQARGKSSWLALFLLLPISNLFAYLYLAFADPEVGKDPNQEKITFD